MKQKKIKLHVKNPQKKIFYLKKKKKKLIGKQET